MIKNKLILSKLLNKMVQDGGKQRSEIDLLKAFKSVQRSKRNKCSKEILKISLKNVSPFFQLKTVKNKSKKSSIEIPYLLTEELRLFHGIKNLISCSNSIKKIPFYRRLQDEIEKSSTLKGQSVKNRKKIHEDAFINRKYARYRWF